MVNDKNMPGNYFKLIAMNFKAHKDNLSQVMKLSVADLKKTYTGSAMGWAWAIVKPIVTIFVYWFAIAVGLKGGSDFGEVPYIVWLVSGIVPWFYMGEAITGGTNCIRRYSYLVTKMKYPIETIPTFTNLSKLYVNLVITAIVVVAFCLFGYFPPIQIVQLPIYIILMFLFFNAWSLFAGLISAISKDFANLVKSFNIAVFWLSGVLWNIENVADSKFLYTLMMLNPVTFICYGFRNSLVYGTWFFEQPKRLIYFICWYVALVFLSLWAYKRLRKEIPDVL